MNEHFANIIKIQSPTRIFAHNSLVVHEKRPVLIADCEHGEVHDLLHVTKQDNESLITLSRPLQFSYDTSAYIGEFMEENWFIKKNAKGNNTLHYQLSQTEELTTLVHSLHVSNQRAQDKPFLEVTFGLAEDKTHNFMVAVRGS